MGKKVVHIIGSELEPTALGHLQDHNGYCESLDDILAAFSELRYHGHRFRGAWRITVEKVSPRVVKSWRAVSKASQDGDK